jgi:hypothetical protein
VADESLLCAIVLGRIFAGRLNKMLFSLVERQQQVLAI